MQEQATRLAEVVSTFKLDEVGTAPRAPGLRQAPSSPAATSHLALAGA
jgi:hypothetical protein